MSLLDFAQTVFVSYVRAILMNSSLLFVRELAATDESKYSYHWQTQKGKLICRWDNAPHHREGDTFPHHKHEGNTANTLPSQEITLEAVLKVIENEILQK